MTLRVKYNKLYFKGKFTLSKKGENPKKVFEVYYELFGMSCSKIQIE